MSVIYSKSYSPSERIDDQLDGEWLWEQLHVLQRFPRGDRSAAIVAMRFSGRDLLSVGKSVGVTRERVRQIEQYAIRRLRLHVTGESWIPDHKSQQMQLFKRGYRTWLYLRTRSRRTAE